MTLTSSCLPSCNTRGWLSLCLSPRPIRLPVSSSVTSYLRRRNVGRNIFPRSSSNVANAGEFWNTRCASFRTWYCAGSTHGTPHPTLSGTAFYSIPSSTLAAGANRGHT